MARQFQTECELVEFYGINVFELPRYQRWALEASKPRIEAQQSITHALRTGGEFTPETWFDLTMYATGGNAINQEEGEWEGGDRDLAEQRKNAAHERAFRRESKE